MDGSAAIRSLMTRWAELMEANRDELIALDGVVGDSDLGLTMSAGFDAASRAVQDGDETDIGKLLYAAGKAMAAAVPSTMGTLMASGLMNAGKVLKGREALDTGGWAELFAAYLDGVQSRGKAQVGEKTFLDGLWPAVDTLKIQAAQGAAIQAAAREAAAAAEQGYQQTRGMLAKHGRMAIRGEDSRKYLDPGAAVAALLMQGFAQSMENVAQA